MLELSCVGKLLDGDLMYITAFFTNNGIPAVALSPTIRIRDAATNALLVIDAAMTEIGDGWYKYDFATYDLAVDYTMLCDGTAALNNSERYVSVNRTSTDIAALVWDAPLSEHATSGTTGYAQNRIALVETDVELIRKIETGRWKFESSQMIIYDDDGETPLIVFDLTDKDGRSITAETNAPAERVPV